MLEIKESTYLLREIEAETKDYDEALDFAKDLFDKGYIADLITGSKKDDEKTTVYFIKAFKKDPCTHQDKKYDNDSERPLQNKVYETSLTKIEEVDMSERLKNCLIKHGIQYLEEIRTYTDEDFFKIKNIGRKCIQEAKDIIYLHLNG